MDEQRQDDQLEPTYHSSVLIEDVALKTYRKQWTIEKGGGRESGRSVLMAWNDDKDDDKKRKSSLKISFKNALYMQATPDDVLWKIQRHPEQFW